MSLILDALKKLEQEKAARRTRQGDIRPALTARKSSPTSPAWRLPALFTGTIILAVAVTLGVTGLFSQKNLPPSPAPVQFPPLPSPTPATTVQPQRPPIPSARVNIPAPPDLPPPSPKRPKGIIPEPTGPTPADLKVTGIAWQDERTARRAVVNGALMGEGADVSGARIVEIRQEQVRFSRDGQSFAIAITSSNR